MTVRTRGAANGAAPEDPKVIPMPEPGRKYRDPVPDDDEIALELAEELQRKLAYFHHTFYEYDGGYWAKRDYHEMYNRIRQFLRPYRARGVKVKSAQITSLLNMMEADLYVPDRVINELTPESERYINFPNGLYDLKEHRMIDHDPELYMTSQLDFDFDPDATCPTFQKFLESSLVLPGTKTTDFDMVVLVQQALGYSLTARTDLKSSFWLNGVPDSGKSTLLALIKMLMGNMAATIDLNQLGTKSFMLAEIIGKRTVSFSESSSGVMLPDALYKAMTGGADELWADVKGRSAITFKPVAKFWWAMNERPRISDRSGATFNRLKLIRFNRSFDAKERDLSLLSKLSNERSGIFNQLMVFYRMLNLSGWQPVKQSEELLAEYELENDTERSFVEDRCEVHDSVHVQSSMLYSAYSDWCLTNGFKPKNRNQAAVEWRRLGFKDRKSDGLTRWQGVRLREVGKLA
jgi:putative DNA primase/helicase